MSTGQLISALPAKDFWGLVHHAPRVILQFIQSWDTAPEREAGWRVQVLLKEHSFSFMGCPFLPDRFCLSALGFLPSTFDMFVPDLPSDTGYWLEAVGGRFQLCISKDFQRTGTSSYGKHCSSCNSFHLIGDSANVYRAPTVCQALYWAYTHCFLHLFIL